MKKYWFALKSHIYVDFKEKNILLYDTWHGNRIESTLDKAITLIRQMYEPANLGVVGVDENMLSEPQVREFVETVIHKDMGDLMDVEKCPVKPVRLIPILNLQKDIDKYKDDENKLIFFEKDIGKYLLELNLYVNSVCDEACCHCDSFCNQVRCCTANGRQEELSMDSLKQLFEQIRYLPINSINVLGGDISKYSYMNELKQLSVLYSKELRYYCHYKNFKKYPLTDFGKVELILTFPIDKSIFREVCLSTDKRQIKWHCIIENEGEYDCAEKLIEEFGIDMEDCDFIPFYTGSNLDFFRKNVFLDKEDIFFKSFQMREIFKNQKLNSNFFGGLYVLPDGTVKANMNAPAIGHIHVDNILDIIQNELINNTAWRLLRDSQPCDRCVYQFICPPPSNYEKIIGQNNLCHIKEVAID